MIGLNSGSQWKWIVRTASCQRVPVFTQNFGGLLAKELWSIIFMNPILYKARKCVTFCDETSILSPCTALSSGELGCRSMHRQGTDMGEPAAGAEESVERHHYNGPHLFLPGIPHRPTWFTTNGTQSLHAERCVITTAADDVKLGGSPFYYLKLHRSSNWYIADQETMIIGHAKQA